MGTRASSLLCALFAGCLALCASSHAASEAPAPRSEVADSVAKPAAGPQRVGAYVLSPERDAKARSLAKVRLRVKILGIAWGLLVLAAILRFRLAAALRDLAERHTRRKILQLLIVVPALMAAIGVATLPLAIYGNGLSRSYGLSVQGWASWFGDWGKGLVLTALLSTLLSGVLYALIRRFPKRWWFAFWLASIPLILLGFFLTPLVIEPLFNRFEPLKVSRPALSRDLLRMVERAGVHIPEDRFFLMHASQKTTALNAYVTGFGGSKRIVLWDTLTSGMEAPGVLFVASHELGHYVLRHLLGGLVLSVLGVLAALFIGARAVGVLIGRWGPRWGIRDPGDWASLPLLLLVASLLSTVGEPLGNLYSRQIEHEADRYALELMHHLTADAPQAGAKAFQKLGEANLSDPAPSALRVLLFYSHPPIAARIRFCLTYDPWSAGGTPVYVR